MIKRIKKTHLVAQNEKQKQIVYFEGVILLSLWHVFKHLTIHPSLSHYYVLLHHNQYRDAFFNNEEEVV